MNSHSIIVNFTSIDILSDDSYSGYRWLAKLIKMVSYQGTTGISGDGMLMISFA